MLAMVQSTSGYARTIGCKLRLLIVFALPSELIKTHIQARAVKVFGVGANPTQISSQGSIENIGGVQMFGWTHLASIISFDSAMGNQAAALAAQPVRPPVNHIKSIQVKHNPRGPLKSLADDDHCYLLIETEQNETMMMTGSGSNFKLLPTDRQQHSLH